MTVSDHTTPPTPSSALEAVNIASAAPNLYFLPSAYDSAAECPFRRPIKILEALHDLNESVNIWRDQRTQNVSGNNIVNIMKARGWQKRCSMHISKTASGVYRRHYEFLYDGIYHLFAPHITIGTFGANTCASIHFIFDETNEKVAVNVVNR